MRLNYCLYAVYIPTYAKPAYTALTRSDARQFATWDAFSQSNVLMHGRVPDWCKREAPVKKRRNRQLEEVVTWESGRIVASFLVGKARSEESL